ncbi:hypothetical protein [Micromonospora sp. CPCC 205561]|uniref:hypothetical protein n=1 Tax=Micromonospora sp. CPCC 205561 TaxID=3122407 RepID=UPI002FEEA33B
MTTPSQPAAPARSFARDVFVNVLANLIAAAIIYLLAVLSGYLKSNPLILILAFLVVAFACIPAGLYSTLWSDRRHTRIGDLWALASFVAIAAAIATWKIADMLQQ